MRVYISNKVSASILKRPWAFSAIDDIQDQIDHERTRILKIINRYPLSKQNVNKQQICPSLCSIILMREGGASPPVCCSLSRVYRSKTDEFPKRNGQRSNQVCSLLVLLRDLSFILDTAANFRFVGLLLLRVFVSWCRNTWGYLAVSGGGRGRNHPEHGHLPPFSKAVW